MEREYVELYDLQHDIRSGLEDLFPDTVWVRAEVASVSVKSNGHCYMELSQTDAGVLVAKAHAIIWRSRFSLLSRAFRQTVGEDLKPGMTIFARVQVSYSELYGLSLVIDDLDAEVTLGQAERIRLETISKLQEEGMMDRQKQLQLCDLPYSLAVISTDTAAGYGDFRRHLCENEYGFSFDINLFEAQMQGAGAPASIVEALQCILESGKRPDAILILRGGGSNLDLACFDDYLLCRSIAACPIPVFTAIGHDRDYHVADMVAHAFVKTPTALSDLFIDCYMAEDERLSNYVSRLKLAFLGKIAAMESRVALMESRIKAADPRIILTRGYTLVTDAEGRVLKQAKGVNTGDRIGVMFSDGKFNATVDGKI